MKLTASLNAVCLLRYETKFKDGKRQEVVIDGKSNQDKTKTYIESLGVSKSDMRKIWCCIYAESTCPW